MKKLLMIIVLMSGLIFAQTTPTLVIPYPIRTMHKCSGTITTKIDTLSRLLIDARANNLFQLCKGGYYWFSMAMDDSIDICEDATFPPNLGWTYPAGSFDAVFIYVNFPNLYIRRHRSSGSVGFSINFGGF